MKSRIWERFPLSWWGKFSFPPGPELEGGEGGRRGGRTE